MLSPPLCTGSPELYICTPARWHVYAGKVRKKINNLERTLTEKCAQEVNGLVEEEEGIYTSGYSSLFQTISRLLLLLGLFSGHHTSPLGEVC